MILLLILPLIAVILIIYSLYWFTKEFSNSRKAGIRVVQVLVLIVIGFILYFLISRESEFFKYHIKETLEENQLSLHYDFKKIKHRHSGLLTTQSGFTLGIDKKDKLNIINNITSSPYFRTIPENYYFDWDQIKDIKINKIIIDSETPSALIREIHTRKPYEDIVITISKNTNELSYEKE